MLLSLDIVFIDIPRSTKGGEKTFNPQTIRFYLDQDTASNTRFIEDKL